jgi:integrase
MLTDKELKAAKPQNNKIHKLYDQAGLHIIVHTNGGKYWRLDYKLDGKRKTTSLGIYPNISLKTARDKAIDFRRLIEQGIDPAIEKNSIKPNPNHNTFEFIAREWGAKKITGFDTTQHNYRRTLERDAFPYIGHMAIKKIKPIDILEILQKVEAKGFHSASHRLLFVCSNVFRYAVATQKIDSDICRDLKGALTPHKVKHFAAITDAKKIGALLKILDDYTGTIQVTSALRLSPLLFVRPSELRLAEWCQINFDKKTWEYFIVKTQADHIVPLSNQAIAILKELHKFSGHGRYVFPSRKSDDKPMGENSVLTALRRRGIAKEEMSAHGFRAMARTVLDEELDFPAHLLEHQLAHKVKDANGTSYNRTKHLAKRQEMMQSWSDYLDGLKTETTTPLCKPIPETNEPI